MTMPRPGPPGREHKNSGLRDRMGSKEMGESERRAQKRNISEELSLFGMWRPVGMCEFGQALSDR